MSQVDLLSTSSLVQVPYVKVTIGNYTFGVYEKVNGYAKYPNYVNSLKVVKINGTVNTYTLELIYQIRAEDDPNYFEKVFSSVSQSRKIVFTYGDSSNAKFLYREEVGTITNVSSRFDTNGQRITYTVSAVSSADLLSSGAYQFNATFDKPSNVIKQLLNNSLYGLTDIFTGMRDIALRDSLIASNDVAINLERKNNISVLDYLSYLVSMMTPISSKSTSKSSVYILTFVDDTSGVYEGSYFKVIQVDTAIEHPEAYLLTIGYPNQNMVTSFNIENNENYSIYYDYQKKLHPQEYVTRINKYGQYVEVYAPILTSNNDEYKTREQDTTWWSKMTQYPIKCSIEVRGLLRPAILMTYVRLKVYLYGKKHISSGLYIVTKQQDTIDASGYRTTLNMTRIAEDDDLS